MITKAVIFIIAAVGFVGAAFGQNYLGTWIMTSGTTKLTLVLNQGAAGLVSGTLSSSTGAVFQLNGRVEEGVIMGTCQGKTGSSQFEASLEGSHLILTLIETGTNGDVTSRSLEFSRSGGGSSTSEALGLPTVQPGATGGKPRGTRPNPPPSRSSDSAPAETQPPKGSGTPISYPEMGISFSVPSGWIAQNQGNTVFLTSTNYKGFILIQRHAYGSLEQMASEARQGIVDEASAIRLVPTSEFQTIGRNGLGVEFSGAVQGRQARSYAIGLIAPQGGGVTILAAVETQSYTEAYPGFVRAIAGGLTFISSGPSVESQVGGASNSDLMRYFAGEWYSYTSGSTIYGSAGTERKMTLCPDGLYRDSSEFSASDGDWGRATAQAGWGRWTIQGNLVQGVIMVRYPNGKSRQITYQKNSKGGKIFDFDGIMFVFAGEATCR